MRASDVIGRRIVAVHQERQATSWIGDKEASFEWVVLSLQLDNGAKLILHAVEADYEPVVVAWVQRKAGEST